jgi:hypothetical protein
MAYMPGLNRVNIWVYAGNLEHKIRTREANAYGPGLNRVNIWVYAGNLEHKIRTLKIQKKNVFGSLGGS